MTIISTENESALCIRVTGILATTELFTQLYDCWKLIDAQITNHRLE